MVVQVQGIYRLAEEGNLTGSVNEALSPFLVSAEAGGSWGWSSNCSNKLGYRFP